MSVFWNHGRLKVAGLSLLGSVAVLIAGCATAPKKVVTAKPAKSGYYIVILNKTPRGISNASVQFGVITVASARFCEARAQRSFGPLAMPIPMTAKLQWTDDEGPHVINALIEGVTSAHLGEDSTIYFAINEDGVVQARVIKFGDSAAFADLMQWVRPAGQYRFGIVNHSERDLKAVSVYYDGRQVGSVGDLTAQAQTAVYTDAVTLPIPDAAEVRWNEEGAPHAAQARLAGVIPGNFADGTILFVITQDGTVEVKPVRWDSGGASTKSDN